MLSEEELEELYRKSLYTLCYMFAYEYSQSVNKLHEDGRWDAWVQGTQERYGPTLNHLLRTLMSKPALAERVEAVYQQSLDDAVFATVGSLTRLALWDIAAEAGTTEKLSSMNLAYLDEGMLDYIPSAMGINPEYMGKHSVEYMWDEWGLETDTWLR